MNIHLKAGFITVGAILCAIIIFLFFETIPEKLGGMILTGMFILGGILGFYFVVFTSLEIMEEL